MDRFAQLDRRVLATELRLNAAESRLNAAEPRIEATSQLAAQLDAFVAVHATTTARLDEIANADRKALETGRS